MKFTKVFCSGLVWLLVAAMAACSAATPETIVQTVEVVREIQGETVTEVQVVTAAPTMAPLPTGMPDMVPAEYTNSARPKRLIIKNAEMTLLVADTDVAVDRVTQLVGDTRAYIVSSRVWYEEHLGKQYKYASLTLGVPVDTFETALRRLREIALRVENETASGQDVTDEYVDLQSRLGNLESTRDRIRTFLDRAQTVEEALQVNKQLAEVEGEIEQVKGRMNYLFDRAAYSTINVQLNPEIPPTPTPTPTLTPTPTPEVHWSLTPTIKSASDTLATLMQGLIEGVVWFTIVFLPFVLPAGLIAWFVFRPRK